jgi:hypothetical protein
MVHLLLGNIFLCHDPVCANICLGGFKSLPFVAFIVSNLAFFPHSHAGWILK